uniref:Uncharacterized protein n=1 Tax=Candidatus Kentrum sp. TUN TaxID=2126343 RepID=A0A450Z9H9_9GAMM|nr:MAG: hypothetical protein BECKTUN1418E_GA0071001_100322 [Candidatus Kentron sp. TUN]VFK51704.1 MAG: hypothetical protein BECKTUN1418F_GA0071002_100322 [Candidatus Kentron sp. TUN]
MNEEKNTSMTPEPGEDSFLLWLVDFVSKDNSKINSEKAFIPFKIEFNLGGGIISGDLISEKNYFEGISQEFGSSFEDKEVGDKVKIAISDFGKTYGESYKENMTPDKIRYIHYIHLKDAVFRLSDKTDHLGWWRGILSQVEGFALSVLSGKSVLDLSW